MVKPEDMDYLEQAFCRDVVNDGSVFDGTDYKLFAFLHMIIAYLLTPRMDDTMACRV